MSDFALVIYKQQDLLSTQHQSLVGRILSSLKRTRYECECEKIEFYNNVSAYVIKLPWELEKILSLDKNRISAMIASMCREKGAVRCLLPGELAEFLRVEGFAESNTHGDILYKLLILDIINTIYSSKNIEISSVDVAIVAGNSKEELFYFVRLLSALFKYITIISSERGDIEGEINRIYIDLGLSVGVTADCKSALKNADLIINLADSNEHIFNAKVNSKALILNYGKLDANKVSAENVLIKGIEITLPHNIAQKVDKEIYKHYKQPKISEIVLTHRLLNYEKINPFNIEQANRASKQFEKDGCYISGFVGRHRILTVDEITL